MDLYEICRNMRGFNYSPSYTASAFERWDSFDADIWRTEIGRGKKYFPKMNTLRVWLDWITYCRNPEKLVKNFGSALDIASEFNLKVIVPLFNRSFGATGNSCFSGNTTWSEYYVDRDFARFEPYLNGIVGKFKNDDRILMWDLCNEPKLHPLLLPLHNDSAIQVRSAPSDIKWPHWGADMISRVATAQLELEWLTWIANTVRKLGVIQPTTLGVVFPSEIEIVADLIDVLCFHPYYGWQDDNLVRLCDMAAEIAQKKGKPLTANETCQGSLDDKRRVEIIHRTLGPLKERGIGWCAFKLQGRPGATREEMSDLNALPGDRGYFPFIEADGSLRPGHEAYNEY